MGSINKKQEFVISKFLKRYNYDGVLEILSEVGIDNGDLYNFISSCKYAVNFDFKTAIKKIDKLSNPVLNRKEIKALKNNLAKLIDGEPEAILSEIIQNIKIQIINEEYIDFLGRLYRLKEALFKYIFVKSQHDNKKDRISMHGNMVSKRSILNTLKKKYNIYNGNLIHGVTNYVNKHVRKTKRMEKVLEMLNTDKLEKLIHLRNECPVGHGFRGVSKEDIEQIYGEPMEVVQDFIKICELLDLEIKTNKYDVINDIIIELIGKYLRYEGDEVVDE
jgi:hypothetical protein